MLFVRRHLLRVSTDPKWYTESIRYRAVAMRGQMLNEVRLMLWKELTTDVDCQLSLDVKIL